ncbi:MAG: hypothetical protein ACMXYD_00735 [Candidatus Woesearchaeota archaeon]
MAIFNKNERRIRAAFNAVHKEFDEHLESINANTEEILEGRYMIEELFERVNKLSEDLLEVKELLGERSEQYEPIHLSAQQQEIFLAVYMHERGVSYSQLARESRLPVSVVQETVFDLITKGIPILKQRREEDIILSLDIEFRERQSKHNLVQVDEAQSRFVRQESQTSLF